MLSHLMVQLKALTSRMKTDRLLVTDSMAEKDGHSGQEQVRGFIAVDRSHY